jgi:hypothetical protein
MVPAGIALRCLAGNHVWFYRNSKTKWQTTARALLTLFIFSGLSRHAFFAVSLKVHGRRPAVYTTAYHRRHESIGPVA